MARIPFNRPAVTGKELHYISQAMTGDGISGAGVFTKKCEAWFEDKLQCPKILLTGSCTHALEIVALLLNLQTGDEIIIPSYTFVSTANAFVLHGGVPVFVDIRPDTMNINEQLIEDAITNRTRAIVAMHYAGVACNMELINAIAECYGLIVIEDAAQALMGKRENQYIGTFGHMATFSFHETKNYTSGEGGALIINDPSYIERAEIIREKGTNRSDFMKGTVDHYSWVDIGSSYIMSELNAAYLYAQLEAADLINERRRHIWQTYHDCLMHFAEDGLIELPQIPQKDTHNGHLFYIKLADKAERSDFIALMNQEHIFPVSHYVPLHSSRGGVTYGRFYGEDEFTTTESERILRLPLFYNMADEDVRRVIDSASQTIKALMNKRNHTRDQAHEPNLTIVPKERSPKHKN
ncbi:MAG: dTDP-4-amino-4,6-dideoxygalactose transaminase [Rickettsiales bacterium]|nr:dTDP-4-amino-4,6-dideoxygalactose transaminase [Rickettsiales bacterium]